MSDRLIQSEKNYLEELETLRDKMRAREQEKNNRDLEYRLMRSKNYYSKQKIADDENHRRVMEDYEAQLEALEQKRDEDFRNLKYYRQLGTITDEQYYSELEALRDTYFEKGSAEWQKYTLEIVNFEKKAISQIADDIAKQADASLSEVAKLKEKFEKKITSANTGLFGESTDTFKINGEVSKVNHRYFNNWEGEIHLMRQYKDALKGVKKRLQDTGFEDGDIKSFFGAVTELSFSDGVKFSDMLSKLSDDDFKKYVGDYNEYFRLADEFSSEIYSSDMEKAYDDVVKTVKEKFSTLGVEIPQEFFNTGVSGAKMFSDGFLRNIQSFFSSLSSEIMAFNSKLSAGMNTGGGNTSISNYQSNITINGNSTAAQDINSYLAAEEINRQRWGV